jgi:hypothetical protein
MNISAQDEARMFPLLREYFAATTPNEPDEVDRYFSDKLLRMARDTDPDTFEEWVAAANQWNAPQLSFAA